jgi:hypothetical protein
MSSTLWCWHARVRNCSWTDLGLPGTSGPIVTQTFINNVCSAQVMLLVRGHPAEHLCYEFAVDLEDESKAPYLQEAFVFQLFPAPRLDRPIVHLPGSKQRVTLVR